MIKIYYIDLQVSSTTDGVIDRVTTDVIGLRVIFFLLRAVDSCANDLHHMRSDLANRYASNLCRKWVAADKNTHNRVYLLSWRDFMTNCEAVLSTNPELLWAV